MPGSQHIGNSTGVKDIIPQVVDSLADIITKGSIIIDFTVPAATLENIALSKKNGAGIVIGTTGFTEKDKAEIKEASQTIPVLLSPNMSMGVNICFKIIILSIVNPSPSPNSIIYSVPYGISC